MIPPIPPYERLRRFFALLSLVVACYELIEPSRCSLGQEAGDRKGALKPESGSQGPAKAAKGSRPDTAGIDGPPRPSGLVVYEGIPKRLQKEAPPPPPPGPGIVNADLATLSAINIPGLMTQYPDKTQNGKSVQAGVFDEGAIRMIAEFMEGKQSRVTIKTQKGPSDHSTEVAVVVAANGLDPRATGVAWELKITSFDDERDLSELADFAKDIPISNHRVSNHSYNKQAGWFVAEGPTGKLYYEWFGGLNETEDSKFGKYRAEAHELDRILHEHPRLVSVIAAGNELSYTPKAQPIEHWAWMPPDAAPNLGHWEQSSIKRKPDKSTDAGKLDTIAGLGISKNAICVGAIEQLVAPNQPQVIADFSSWGPTDDNRVKPDVVAPGKMVYVKDSNGVLKPVDGTSFAAPIVAGLSALLVEFFEKTFKRSPTSAEIKAPLIHSARREGIPAPDPNFGWGLVDAVGAADVIAGEHAGSGRRFLFGEIRQGDTNTYTYVRPDGEAQRIRATLVWDRPSSPRKQGCP